MKLCGSAKILSKGNFSYILLMSAQTVQVISQLSFFKFSVRKHSCEQTDFYPLKNFSLCSVCSIVSLVLHIVTISSAPGLSAVLQILILSGHSSLHSISHREGRLLTHIRTHMNACIHTQTHAYLLLDAKVSIRGCFKVVRISMHDPTNQPHSSRACGQWH